MKRPGSVSAASIKLSFPGTVLDDLGEPRKAEHLALAVSWFGDPVLCRSRRAPAGTVACFNSQLVPRISDRGMAEGASSLGASNALLTHDGLSAAGAPLSMT